MLTRFFAILQRNWTYEVEYRLEVWRMAFINLVTIGIPAIIYRIPNTPRWILLVFGFGPAFVFWLFYVRYSVGRLIQIKCNRKYATIITSEQLRRIMAAYPRESLYCKVNGKYRRVTNASEVQSSDEILLITIGKKQLIDLKKYKKIIAEDKPRE